MYAAHGGDKVPGSSFREVDEPLRTEEGHEESWDQYICEWVFRQVRQHQLEGNKGAELPESQFTHLMLNRPVIETHGMTALSLPIYIFIHSHF